MEKDLPMMIATRLLLNLLYHEKEEGKKVTDCFHYVSTDEPADIDRAIEYVKQLIAEGVRAL